MLDLSDIKNYLRVDGEADDTSLTSLKQAAILYIENAIGYVVDELNDLHRLAILILIAHWYENREAVGKADKLAYSFESILFQMKYGGGTSEI